MSIETSRSDVDCLALVIADGVHRDPTTGRMTLLGCHGEIDADRFPSVHATIVVYAEFLGLSTEDVLAIEIERAETGEIIATASGGKDVSAAATGGVVGVAFELHDVSFAEPGDYLVRLKRGAELLASRPFPARDRSASAAIDDRLRRLAESKRPPTAWYAGEAERPF